MATYVEDGSKLLTVGKAASILGVHPNILRKWAEEGLLPSWRIGPRRDQRFQLSELWDFMEVKLPRYAGA